MKNELISKRLRELRKSHGYNQEYVASHLGIIRQTYSHYETGRSTPSTETLNRIAMLYSISFENLLQLLYSDNQVVYLNKPTPSPSVNELSTYLDYINNPINEKKYKFLKVKEKELLYYFEQLSSKDQCDILDFIKIKAKNKSH